MKISMAESQWGVDRVDPAGPVDPAVPEDPTDRPGVYSSVR